MKNVFARTECELPLKNSFCCATMDQKKRENVHQSLNLLANTRLVVCATLMRTHTWPPHMLVYTLARYEQEDK